MLFLKELVPSCQSLQRFVWIELGYANLPLVANFTHHDNHKGNYHPDSVLQGPIILGGGE